MKQKLRNLILSAVVDLGTADINQVLAAVGTHISAAQASAAGRRVVRNMRKRWNITHHYDYPIIDHGKRHLVCNNLNELVRTGRLVRVGRGVYSIPKVSTKEEKHKEEKREKEIG